MNPDRALDEFTQHVKSPEIDLGVAALAIARIEHPDLAPGPALAELDELAARSSVSTAGGGRRALDRLCAFLFEGEKFRGNADDYYDPRNSYLNEVLDRRLGIPITLAVVVLEVGRRAGVDVRGVNFPGHFLVRAVPAQAAPRLARPGAGDALDDGLFVDAFAGRLLSSDDVRALYRRHTGSDDEPDTRLLQPTTKHQILARMLRNLREIHRERGDAPALRGV